MYGARANCWPNIVKLRKLAKYCNYGDCLDIMLHDKIVCGIQDETLQRKCYHQSLTSRTSEIVGFVEAAARVCLRIYPTYLRNLPISAVSPVYIKIYFNQKFCLTHEMK